MAALGVAFKRLDRYSTVYFFIYTIMASARDWSVLYALRSLESLPSFGLLIIAKCCFTLLPEGIFSSLEVSIVALVTLTVLGTTVEEVRAFRSNLATKYVRLDDTQSDSITTISTASKPFKHAVYISFIPLLAWLVRGCLSSTSLTPWITQQDPLAGGRSLDVVISYFDEPMDGFHNLKNEISSRLQYRNVEINWILYLKNNVTDMETLQRDTGIQKIIRLPNTGREGGTYLKHILLNYNATIDPSTQTDVYRGLADKTLFVQPVSVSRVRTRWSQAKA
jgi:hypothetical protein